MSPGSIPYLKPLAPLINEKPANYLRLPRELRDQVYTSLLSTKYTTNMSISSGALLLEPFRRLHSTNNLQIIGSIPEKDKAEVIADTSRNLPKNQEPFDHVFTCFKEAISKNDCGDFATSISELGNALNELDDAISLYRGDVETEIMAGPYARCTIWNAYEHIEFSEKKLGQKDVHTADQ
ncbi:hypothetical protein HO173_008586 [Letharia columbiana]|uniref:Uncharacterized protein n=1 Tax=Letharia columbiana TaxID=112416 RepID=A0A8H6FRI5_9LECA|nr:uncharacterized protein HO173_008586 [Letharia columbiana]KAF6233295.1 hypothetical protein HO173_008586 [Letharia columbiana]